MVWKGDWAPSSKTLWSHSRHKTTGMEMESSFWNTFRKLVFINILLHAADGFQNLKCDQYNCTNYCSVPQSFFMSRWLVTHLVKKFPALYRTWGVVVMFVKTCHYILSWDHFIHSILAYRTAVRSPIVFFHLSLGF